MVYKISCNIVYGFPCPGYPHTCYTCIHILYTLFPCDNNICSSELMLYATLTQNQSQSFTHLNAQNQAEYLTGTMFPAF